MRTRCVAQSPFGATLIRRLSLVSASIQPENPAARKHQSVRPSTGVENSRSRSRSQGVVDIGCHSMHGMVCGRPRFSI
jgi:hypothetical protein